MKLRFIKNWGNYKTGDILENPSSITAHALMNIYEVAEEIKEETVKSYTPPKKRKVTRRRVSSKSKK